MQTIKEEENKNTTKDVLLHQIFQDISEENAEIPHDGYLDEIIPLPTTRWSQIRGIQKKRQLFFIGLLVLAIIYVLFDSDSEEEIEKNNDPIENIKPVAKKMIQKPILVTKPTPVVEKEPDIETPIVIKKKNRKQEVKQKPNVPLSAREKAKEDLRLQLRN